MTLIFRTTNTTVLKRKPIQALELPETEKQTLDAGKELEVQSYLIIYALPSQETPSKAITPGMHTSPIFKFLRMAR
jgi:hypothetical protein